MIQHLPTARGRFAPSPSGPLHRGSILAALGSWLIARKSGAEWLIRIEDVDRDRCHETHAHAQLADLAALGLHSDAPVQWQSRNGDRYQRELQRLLQQGLAFECHCSRADIKAMGGVHHQCVNPSAAGQAAIRMRVPHGAVVRFEDELLGMQVEDVYAQVGDFVLRRADGQWSYQFAVVVDDQAQGITQVVRGRDLLDSTARQILLQEALGYRRLSYAHLPLLLDAEGRKLSKREDASPALLPSTDPLAVLQSAWTDLRQVAWLPASSVAEFLGMALDRFEMDRLRN